MKPKDKARASRSAAQKPSTAGAKAKVARLEDERRGLQERLTAAEQKIAILERQRDEALNRIEWVIDSIRTLTDEVRRSP